MPTATMPESSAPSLKGGKDSIEPTKRNKDAIAATAVNDALLVILVSLGLLVALIWSLRSNNV